MFVNETLKTYLETSSKVSVHSNIIAGWNMNLPDNIFKIGNYRYRPYADTTKYATIPSTFDPYDYGYYYTNATNADIIVDGGVDNTNTPVLFQSGKEKEKLIYSLEDCLKPFRPNSGINKATYFNNKYLNHSSKDFAARPRYYMPSRYDQFKYWTSYRTETTYKYIYNDSSIGYGPSPTFTDKDGTIQDGSPHLNAEYGVSNYISNNNYFITDAAPFVVYKNPVPTNKIVVRMQTNVGSVDLGTMSDGSKNFNDPLYGDVNKTTPVRWRIQYLKNNNWIDAYSFNESSTREDGSPIINSDGQVNIAYGLIVPELYKDYFVYMGTVSSTNALPQTSYHGHAYLLIQNEGELGQFYIWNSTLNDYDTENPRYGWQLAVEEDNYESNVVRQVTNPLSFLDTFGNITEYREFQYISGLRVVVDTMNKNDCTFDLIEMSPRLLVDFSNYATSFNITKTLSGLSETGLPTGSISVSTGTLNILDIDQSFNSNNTSSLLAPYLTRHVFYNFFETVSDDDGVQYRVPIKTLFSNNIPQVDGQTSEISIDLRDRYFYFESMPAPQLFLTNVSLSYAVSILLDSIGFSRYSFLRINGEEELVIPYFFVAPDQNVAEVLEQLCRAAQCSMFFDEYNTFIIMSKGYLTASEDQRSASFVLSAKNNQTDTGVVKNSSSGNLPNIFALSLQDRNIYNNGKISYTTRYIQRSYGSIRQASMVDAEKTWIYKPSLLWEVSGTETTKTINEVASKQGSYVLGAMPINSNLDNVPPTVENHQIINNTIDLGENIYWLTRYQGYFYANGEIIRYDAAEFSISLPVWYGPDNEVLPLKPGQQAPDGYVQGSSNVWISSNQEYQKYFSVLPFNGKIYPTGLVRIYTEPYYEVVDGVTRMQNGSVASHGRAQFGTQIASHSAGISTYWSDNSYMRGCDMQSQYLFTTQTDFEIPSTELGVAGKNDSLARQTSRTGIIKNFMSSNYISENNLNNLKSTQSGTVQSSALVMSGPSFRTTDIPLNFISYIYKNLDNPYKHFGTRMRIVGKIENNESRPQTAVGSTTYYQVPGVQPNQNINIGGGSGGIAVMVNPDTNVGYYFEIIALTEDNVESYLGETSEQSLISNLVFYKVKKDQSTSNAIPIKLWGGFASVLVDDGKFTGQYRISNEEKPTVYDIAVEYENIANSRRFYLYVNNKLIATVDDTDPLPVYNNIAVFVRGSSKCMFENIYAISENYSQNTVFNVADNVTEVFGESKITANESLRKYAMSGVVQQTYLSGISGQQPPKYNMYFEEFGTIMRECSYFNVRYDKAYPALYAQLSPIINGIRGYVTSGFYADAYGAEFLIFNATDSALNLDETTGNFLRIQGITFTQDTTHELTVDEYFKKRSNFSDPELMGSSLLTSVLVEKEKYDRVKLSRLLHGTNEFSLESPYIQTQDAAEDVIGWILEKTMEPKQLVGVDIFSIPILQLGDIITVEYSNSDDTVNIIDPNKRFVVYQIDYNRNVDGPDMKVYLSEV